MTEHTRVVVVGGGLAGLAAATYLARGGAQATVLEKASTAGGRAITDIRHGYAMNRGVHALYTGGAASAVLQELGVRYTSGMPRNVHARDARGLHVFPGSAPELVRTTLLSGSEKGDLVRIFLKVGMARPASVAHQSVAEWINSATKASRVQQLLRSLARVNLYSDSLEIASAELFVSRLQQTIKHPIHYIDGGWQSLVDGLQRVATAAGVQILNGATAAEIHADGVSLHTGDRVQADAIVLALPLEDAARLVPRLNTRASEAVPVYTACLDLALDRLPVPQHPIVFDLEQPLFMTTQSEVAKLAPPGGAVMHTFVQLDPRAPASPETARAKLHEFISEVQPGWEQHVVEQQFLPHMLAASWLPLATQNGFAGRASPRSQDRENLYFAGDWVGSNGFLIDASLASAREAARLILQRVPSLKIAA